MDNKNLRSENKELAKNIKIWWCEEMIPTKQLENGEWIATKTLENVIIYGCGKNKEEAIADMEQNEINCNNRNSW